MTEGFDYRIADSQGTSVQPIDPAKFDLDKYADYAARLDETAKAFWSHDAGVAVYRRVRVPEVFSFGCRSKEDSLALQLAGLEKSMDYAADVPNFIEPWYGIGTVAASFGAEYEWAEGQAPAVKHLFSSIDEALDVDPVPVEQTSIGKTTLEMIEYFLDVTKGRIPMSICDVQSPLNVASGMIDINNFFMGLFDNPEGVRTLLDRIADLLIDFTRRQVDLIGDALAWPGHGFASSRAWNGMGMSDDTVVMLSDEQYRQFALPSMVKVGQAFGGPVFHSCGDWSSKTDMITGIEGLVMADGAFSEQTDPGANPPEPFGPAFAGSGICLNARVVGNEKVILEKFRELYRPGLKLVLVTYCDDPAEQDRVYEAVHAEAK
jgi:hypothetical protein